MEEKEYKGYKIIYFPEEFKPPFSSSSESRPAKVTIMQGKKVKVELKFTLPYPKNFRVNDALEKALEKSQQIIDDNFENLEPGIFDYSNGGFTERAEMADMK